MISIKNHSYWSYVHQLSYLGRPHSNVFLNPHDRRRLVGHISATGQPLRFRRPNLRDFTIFTAALSCKDGVGQSVLKFKDVGRVWFEHCFILFLQFNPGLLNLHGLKFQGSHCAIHAGMKFYHVLPIPTNNHFLGDYTQEETNSKLHCAGICWQFNWFIIMSFKKED